MSVPLRLLALVALAGLAGCGSQAPAPAAPATGGEVLPGTVSDAMLDTSRSRAEPPLLPVRPTDAAPGNVAAASEAADDLAPEPAPAAAGDAAPANPPPR